MDNCFYCYSDLDGFGFGSDPYFGLFIDKSLSKGSSHSCKTYSNAVLSDDKHFNIKELEIYGWIEEENIY